MVGFLAHLKASEWFRDLEWSHIMVYVQAMGHILTIRKDGEVLTSIAVFSLLFLEVLLANSCYKYVYLYTTLCLLLWCSFPPPDIACFDGLGGVLKAFSVLYEVIGLGWVYRCMYLPPGGKLPHFKDASCNFMVNC